MEGNLDFIPSAMGEGSLEASKPGSGVGCYTSGCPARSRGWSTARGHMGKAVARSRDIRVALMKMEKSKWT